MSIHVVSDWDGASEPGPQHVTAVVSALRQNYARQGRWTPLAFAVLNPSDSVMFAAATLLDICGFAPGQQEIQLLIDQIEDPDRRRFEGALLLRVLAVIRKEEEDDSKTDQSDTGD